MKIQTANFWKFSNSFYADDGVAAACLSLQNNYGFDVNLVLFCFWFGFRSGELDPHTLDAAWSLSCHWRQQVVQPLRQVRQWMKSRPNTVAADQLEEFAKLRERIKDNELAAEKIQQQSLQSLTEHINIRTITPEQAVLASRANFISLCTKMSLPLDAAMEALLVELERAMEKLAP